MIRLLLRTAIYFGSAAIGLLIASWVIDGFEVTASGFLTVVVLFALIQSILTPFLMKVAAKNASAFVGGIGLLSTFIALLAASMIGDSLTIEGGTMSWVAATVVVWLATAVASFLLPFVLVKKAVSNNN